MLVKGAPCRNTTHPIIAMTTEWSLNWLITIKILFSMFSMFRVKRIFIIFQLWVHYGLVTPYGDIDLGQHWLR